MFTFEIILFLSTQFVLYSSGERCSAEYCNFAGNCTTVNQKPTCQCYEEIFQGEFCEKVKDLCLTDKNMCKSHEVCVPYVGQTICNCLPQQDGLDCSPKEEISPTKMMCTFNVRAVYGQEENILLSFEEVGSEPYRIDISTPRLLIANDLRSDRPSQARKLRHTNNLTATLSDLGIRMHTRPPYKDAYYYVFTAQYFELGETTLNISVRSLDSHSESMVFAIVLSLAVHVVKPIQSRCLPKVVFQHGMNPKLPRPVQFEQFSNIQAIVERSCSKQHTTQWSIYDSETRICYYTSKIGKSLLLKIPLYELRYKFLEDIYPDMVVTVVLAYKETNYPLQLIRCYIRIIVRNVIARIVGGAYREVNPDRRLILDASQSREPLPGRREDRRLLYSWTLSEEDGSNEKTLAVDSLDPMLNIPSEILDRDFKNLIKLTIANRIIKSRSNSFTQVIRVVTFRPLIIDIECVRNCQSNLFNIDHSLHLRAICHECVMPVYTWKMNGENMNLNNERFVTELKSDLGEEIIIQLDIVDQNSKAYTEITLKVSEPPTGGHCTIEPRAGEECFTKFHILCVGYEDPENNSPLLYALKLGTIYADYTYSAETFLYLNDVDKLSVHICNAQFSCTVENLSFGIEPSSDLEVNNTFHMLNDMGQRQQVFCILQKLSTSPGQMEYMGRHLKQMEQDTTSTMMEMMNTLEIAYSSMKSLGRSIKDHEAHILSHVIGRIISTFNIINRDTEILDMPIKMYLNMANTLTNIAEYLSIQKSGHLQAQLIHSDFDPFDDKFANWTKFDKDITQRISRYSKLVRLIFDLWKLIGSAATHHIHPSDKFEYAKSKLNYKLEMHAANTKISYTSHDSYCNFEVPMLTVANLRNKLQTKALMIQTWCFHDNIFWWVPETWHPTTAILGLNIYGRNGRDDSGPEATENNVYSLSVRNVDSTARQRLTQTDVLHHSLVVYKLLLQGQANLIVQLFNASRSLRVLVRMNVEPTLFNLYDANCLVPIGKERTIVLRNRCPKQSTAYIAVYKANYFDFSPITYSYSLRVHECCEWNRHSEDPHWSRNPCLSKNTTHTSLYSQYYVNHLSVFSAKDYSVLSNRVPNNITFIKDMPVNKAFVTFICLMILGTLALLLIGKKNCVSNHNLVRVIQWNRDEIHPKTENIIVHIRTGSMLLAYTTANIQLVFKSDLGRYKVIVFQDTCKPYLDTSTSCLLRLSDEKVQLPCSLTISLDESGRYPTWYCRAIQVDDLRRDLSYTFPIYRWIKRGQKVKVSSYRAVADGDKDEISNTRWINFKRRFRHYLKQYFINWYLVQPILGPWRYTDESCNTFQRICIWICKIILTITLIFCYCSNTTYVNYNYYEQQRSGISIFRLLELSFISYLATVTYDMILMFLTRT